MGGKFEFLAKLGVRFQRDGTGASTCFVYIKLKRLLCPVGMPLNGKPSKLIDCQRL